MKVIIEKCPDLETPARGPLKYETLTGEESVDPSGRNIAIFDDRDNHDFMRPSGTSKEIDYRLGSRAITYYLLRPIHR
jgi:hypothetical protein